MAVNEIIRRIHTDDYDAFLELRAYPDAPNNLELCTTSPEGIAFFGKVSIIMNPKFAEILGNALIATVKEMQEQGKNNASRY